jgi:hypothetical protein
MAHALIRRIVPLAAVMLAAACSHDATGSNDFDVLLHRQQWQSLHMTSYTFGYRRASMIDLEPAVVEVRDGRVVGARSAATGNPLPPEKVRAYPTVDDLFDQIVLARKAPSATLKVRWNESLGYPTFISYRSGIPDIYYDDTISNLRPELVCPSCDGPAVQVLPASPRSAPPGTPADRHLPR